MENIDLEEGKILVEGEWLTEDEIRYAIKMKVARDDYNVSELAFALKTLISEMNKSTLLRVRVPKALAEEFEKLSKDRGKSVQAMLRAILIEYMGRRNTPTQVGEEDTDTYGDIEIGNRMEGIRIKSTDGEEPLQIQVNVKEADVVDEEEEGFSIRQDTENVESVGRSTPEHSSIDLNMGEEMVQEDITEVDLDLDEDDTEDNALPEPSENKAGQKNIPLVRMRKKVRKGV
jgi:hypothetical protein